MRFFEFTQPLDETVGDAGYQYELAVYSAVKKARVPGLSPGDKPAAGYSAHGAGDIEGNFNGKEFNVEVKLNRKAQMGGGSVRYDRAAGNIVPSEKLSASADAADLSLILAAIRAKMPAMDAYLDELANIEPKKVHAMYASNGIPFVAAKDARSSLKSSGHHKALNDIVKVDAKHIVNMYNKKGVYYIQIGGAGLFYMGSNPLNLPIPAFSGEAQVEIRLGYAGDTTGSVTKAFNNKMGNTGNPVEARAGAMRCLARLLTDAKSNYTLDDPESIQKLFGSVPATKAKAKPKAVAKAPVGVPPSKNTTSMQGTSMVSNPSPEPQF